MKIRTEGRRSRAARKFELAGKLDELLIATAIANAREQQKTLRLEDGEGLRLVVTPTSARWVFRFVSESTGTRREMGLGSYPSVGLLEARESKKYRRGQIDTGVDPLEARRRNVEAERKAKAAEDVKTKRAAATLESAARDYHKRISGQFRNAKHSAQWLASLENHVFETLGDRPVDQIEAKELLELLLPLRDSVPETTRRIRQRLDAIFEYAMLYGLADRNPAQAILRAMREGKSRREERHFAAIDYRDVPAFLAKLRAFDRVGISARAALEWTILTGARTGETLGATWGEIDIKQREWRIPSARMKMGRMHRVPLTKRALDLLRDVESLRASKNREALVFPSPMDPRKRLSNMAMAMAMRRLGYGDDGTVHGFRQCLSTWAREHTRYRIDTIEAALAHRDEDKVARAYSHAADYWDERCALAADWSKFCTTPPHKKRGDNVVPLENARRAMR